MCLFFIHIRLLIRAYTYSLHLCAKMDPGTSLFQFTLQSTDNIGGMVWYRENPIAAFCLKRHSCFFEKFHYILRSKGIKSTVQKLRIGHHCPKQFFCFTVICNITTSFSCNIHFLSKLFVLFQNVDLMTGSGQKNTCHHSCRSAAND